MKYWKYVELRNFEVIREKALAFVLTKPTVAAGRTFWNTLDKDAFNLAVPELNEALSEYENSVEYVAAIVKTDHIHGTIHIDGMATGMYPCAARLQLPLLNTEGSLTKFYKSPGVIEKRFNGNGTFYLHVTDQAGCIEIDSVEIVRPTIFRISTPHTVIAGPKTPRITLTVKLSKDPVYMLEDADATL